MTRSLLPPTPPSGPGDTGPVIDGASLTPAPIEPSERSGLKIPWKIVVPVVAIGGFAAGLFGIQHALGPHQQGGPGNGPSTPPGTPGTPVDTSFAQIDTSYTSPIPSKPPGKIEQTFVFPHLSGELALYGQSAVQAQGDSAVMYVHWHGDSLMVNNRAIDPVCLTDSTSAEDVWTDPSQTSGADSPLHRAGEAAAGGKTANLIMYVMKPPHGLSEETYARHMEIVSRLGAALQNGLTVQIGTNALRYSDGKIVPHVAPEWVVNTEAKVPNGLADDLLAIPAAVPTAPAKPDTIK